MDEYNNSDDPKLSKYNSGIAQLYRIDNLWKDCHRFSRNGEHDKWNWSLDRVWVELAPDISEKDDKNNSYDKINQEIGQLKNRLIKQEIRIKDYLNELYNLLNKKELFLRRLQNEVGKGSAYEDDFDAYLDG